MSSVAEGILSSILSHEPPPFAIVHRPEKGTQRCIDLMLGPAAEVNSLAELPLPARPSRKSQKELLAIIPFRQASERGFDVIDDGAPLIVMPIAEHASITLEQMVSVLPDITVDVSDERFIPSDDEYAAIVKRVVQDAIGTGEGANFVIRRNYMAQLEADSTIGAALSLFRHLLRQERGAYWTFVVFTGSKLFVGASPERHISVKSSVAVMNPISGTYRYPAAGPNVHDLMEFLDDQKESNELYMVLDEELKMMTKLCKDGPTVLGPHLKEMSQLAHTEYFIKGRTALDVREILRETLFAPTVSGSPLQNAFRVISRYETSGRGYYSGVVALVESDGAGHRNLDSAIMIRTADIGLDGSIQIGVGSTIVRDSDPAGEAAETRAKAAGLIGALKLAGRTQLKSHPDVLSSLSRRNGSIAPFWFTDSRHRCHEIPGLAGKTVLVIDAEDSFTLMLARQLEALGLIVTLKKAWEKLQYEGYDIAILGPGPGNPADASDLRIAHLNATIQSMLANRYPFVAVCLSHQILSLGLGLSVALRSKPNQGVQKRIDLFGATKFVGFYNTYEAQSPHDAFHVPDVGRVEVSRNRDTNEVHAMRGEFFASTQFHPESVLTQDGPEILSGFIRHALECRGERFVGSIA